MWNLSSRANTQTEAMSDIILGADGLVGRALSRALPNAHKFSHEQLDITSYQDMLGAFDFNRPKIVYLAAACANVDSCQNENTDAINVGATIMCLRLCEMFNAKLVWFSSSYVFNGLNRVPYEESHPTDPVQHYGKQKETVEQHILHSGHKALIVRTVGVFGSEHGNRNFVKQVAASVAAGRKVFAPVDQYMNPIYAVDLAERTVELAQRFNGIYHVAGNESVSKFEFASEVAKFFGKEQLVMGVTSEAVKQKAPRPRMGSLDCSVIERLGMIVPDFSSRLGQFLSNEYGA